MGTRLSLGFAKCILPVFFASLATASAATTDANEAIAPLHDRMPVILPEATWPAWLGETEATADALRRMLKPLPPSQLQMWPVDKRVGNVKNEGAELVLPMGEVVVTRNS